MGFEMDAPDQGLQNKLTNEWHTKYLIRLWIFENCCTYGYILVYYFKIVGWLPGSVLRETTLYWEIRI
jgi:hypothetical protein